MSTILFTKVGRNKRTWSKAMPGYVDLSKIAKEAKRGAGLMSRGVEAAFYENADLTGSKPAGVIFAGFRTVGKFEVVDEKP